MTNSNTPSTPLSLYGFLRPRPEHAAFVKDLMLSLVDKTRLEEGNLEYHVHEHPDGTVFLYEVWRSQDDLDRHATLPELQEFFAHLDDYLQVPLEAYAGTMVSAYAA